MPEQPPWERYKAQPGESASSEQGPWSKYTASAPATVPGMEKLGTLPGVPTVPQTGRQAGAARELGAAPDFNPNAGSFIDDYVIEPGMRGIKRAGEGIAAMSRPGADDKFAGAGDVLSGVGEAASPYMAAGALMNPGMAVRAAVRGGVGAGVAGTAAHVIAPDAPGFQSFAGKAGGLVGAGTTKAGASSLETPSSNAMGNGPQMPTVPGIAEWIPGVGSYISKYNKVAKMANGINAPRVEQVRGSLQVPSTVGYPKPESALVEQVRGSHSVPSTAGYPQPRVEVPPVEQVPGKPAPIPQNHPLARVQDLGPDVLEPHPEAAYPTQWGGPQGPGPIERPPGGSWGKGYRATKAPGVGPLEEPSGGWPDVKYVQAPPETTAPVPPVKMDALNKAQSGVPPVGPSVGEPVRTENMQIPNRYQTRNNPTAAHNVDKRIATELQSQGVSSNKITPQHIENAKTKLGHLRATPKLADIQATMREMGFK